MRLSHSMCAKTDSRALSGHHRGAVAKRVQVCVVIRWNALRNSIVALTYCDTTHQSQTQSCIELVDRSIGGALNNRAALHSPIHQLFSRYLGVRPKSLPHEAENDIKSTSCTFKG